MELKLNNLLYYNPWLTFIMVTIMDMFNNLMKLSAYNNNGNMQPHVTTYPKHVHLQLQNLQNP